MVVDEGVVRKGAEINNMSAWGRMVKKYEVEAEAAVEMELVESPLVCRIQDPGTKRQYEATAPQLSIRLIRP